MRKQLLVALLLVAGIQSAWAQKYDVGVNLGLSGYMGDLNQRNPLAFNRGGFGITLRKNFNPDFSLKLAFSQILLHADDASSGIPDQVQRNLRFNSWVTEASAQVEFNFFKFNPFDKQESLSPYIFTGLGGFHFNPYTFLNGNKIYLHDVGTEGQFVPKTVQPKGSVYPAPYSRFSVCIPIGVGFKYHLKGNFSFVTEYGFRLTLTDYLDDIAGKYPDTKLFSPDPNYAALSNRSGYPYASGDQRGGSWKYDKYFYGSVGIIYTFRSIDCPTFYK